MVLIALTAGCGTTAQLTDTSTRNATLPLSAYERTAEASPVDTRLFWDRSENWEDPGNRNVTVTSRAYAYRNASGADAVVVYTTPKKPYAGDDKVRSMSPAALAELATGSVRTPPLGTDSDPAYRAALLERTVTVHELTRADGDGTAHVASTSRDDAYVVVVVTGGAERSTVERILGGVTRYANSAAGAEG